VTITTQQSATTTLPSPDRLLRQRQVLDDYIPIKDSAWRAGVKRGDFPQPVKVGRSNCWLRSTIVEFMKTGAGLVEPKRRARQRKPVRKTRV
jgi:predicted DNA-binding transcriptional regulator AlpA